VKNKDSPSAFKTGGDFIRGLQALLFGGDDFQPVSVRVRNEVNSHCGVLVANAAHFLMLGIGGVKIVHLKGEMKLAVAKVLGAVHIAQPGELELKIALLVAKIDNDEGAVFRVYAAHFLKAERFLVEF